MVEKSRYIREGSPDFFGNMTTIAGMIQVKTPGSGEYLYGSQNQPFQTGLHKTILTSFSLAVFGSKALTAYTLSMILFILILLLWFDFASVGPLLVYFSSSGSFESLPTTLMWAVFYPILCRILDNILHMKYTFINI